MKKIKIIADRNIKSQKIKRFVEKKIKLIKNFSNHLNIVIGGDGFMLATLKKNKNPLNLFSQHLTMGDEKLGDPMI